MVERTILTCEHATNRVPRRYASLFRSASAALAGHRGYDPGAERIARILAKTLDAPVYVGAVSRLLVDLNRSVGHPKLFSEFVCGLGPREKARIVTHYYAPYREEVEAAMASEISRGRRVLHFSIHSFVPELAGHRRRADVGLLYDPARELETTLCRDLKIQIGRMGQDLIIRRNYPYRGTSDGLTTHLRSVFPADLYAGIEIEFNQKCVAQSGELRRWAGIAGRAIGRVSSAS